MHFEVHIPVQSIKCERCIIMWNGHLIFGEISQSYLIESKFLIADSWCFSCNALWRQHFSHVSLETDYNAVCVINYIILRSCSSFSVQPIATKI